MSSIKYLSEGSTIKYGSIQTTSSQAYGGYIIGASITIGYNDASSATLTIVSEDGKYNISEKDLYVSTCTQAPMLLTLGLKPVEEVPDAAGTQGVFEQKGGFVMFCYPIKFEVSTNSGGNILTVEVVEASIDYFNKLLVVTKNNKLKGRTPPGVLYVGKEYFSNSSSTKNELISRDEIMENALGYPALAEEARTTFGTYYYTPKDLAVELQKSFIPCTDKMIDFLKGYNDIYLSSTSSLQGVLQEIGGKLGAMFFWNGVDAAGAFDLEWGNFHTEEQAGLIGIDVIEEVDLLALTEEEMFGANKEGLLSKTSHVSIKDTSITSQLQRAELPAGAQSNPQYASPITLTRLTPQLGKIGKCDGTEMTLFDSDTMKDGDPTHERVREQWRRLNLLKAIALGPDFARTYILLKKSEAFRQLILAAGGRVRKTDAFTTDNLSKAGADDNAPVIGDYTLVDELFPDCCDGEGKWTPAGGCGTAGLTVIAPGSPIGVDWGVNDVPQNPAVIAQLLQEQEGRNPRTPGPSSKLQPNPKDIDALKRQMMVLYVRNKGVSHTVTRPDEGGPKSNAHPFVPNEPNMQANETYAQLEKFTKNLNSYYYSIEGSGYWPKGCMESLSANNVPFRYKQQNWPALPAAEFNIDPSQDELQATRVQDLGWLSEIGEAYTTGFQNLDNKYTAIADFTENLSRQGALTGADLPPNTPNPMPFDHNYSCLTPLSKAGVDLKLQVDKANCEINQADTIKFWKNNDSLKVGGNTQLGALNVSEHYFNPVSFANHNVNQAQTNMYSAAVVFKPTGTRVIEIDYRFFSGDDNEIKTKKFEVHGVDDLDYMVQGVDIGVDVNGFPTNSMSVSQIFSPDRYEEVRGKLVGLCYRNYNFYRNEVPNIEIFGDDRAMSVIPDKDGTGASDRSSYSNLLPSTGCDKTEEAKTPYTGLTQRARHIITNNMEEIANTQFELSRFTDPTYSYTYECLGIPQGGLPMVSNGLSSFSINVGTDGPRISFTVGSARLRKTVLEQDKHVVQLRNGTRTIKTNDVADVFSQKFLNKMLNPKGARALSPPKGAAPSWKPNPNV